MRLLTIVTALILVFSPLTSLAAETNPALDQAAKAFKSKHWAETVKAVDRMVNRGKLTGPDLGRARAWRCIALLQLDRPTTQALKDGLAAPKLAPKFAPAFFARALVNDHKGNYDESIYDLNRATELDSNYFEAILYRGVLNLQLHRLLMAWPDIDLTVRMRPKDPRGYLYRAILLLERKFQGDAVKDARKALELAPKLNRARLVLGLALAKENKNREALRELEAYTKIQSDDPQAYMAMAEACEKTGQWNQAVEYWKKTAALIPGADLVTERLKKAQAKAGQGG